jgi:hypothetical protein
MMPLLFYFIIDIDIAIIDYAIISPLFSIFIIDIIYSLRYFDYTFRYCHIISPLLPLADIIIIDY